MSRVEVLPTSSDEDETPVTTAHRDPTEAEEPTSAPLTPEESAAVFIQDVQARWEAMTEKTTDMEKAAELKTKGNSLFASRQYGEALAVYREAALLVPIRPIEKVKPPSIDEPTTEGGNETDKDKDGSPKAEEATPEDTTDYTLTAQLFCNGGVCYFTLEDYENAMEMFSEAIRHDKKYTKAYLKRAESYYHLEKWSTAYADYETYTTLAAPWMRRPKRGRGGEGEDR
ncbi:hypothetical protein AGDE_07924 [Angomonas deanei]|nr:hypothetical protein AGDE_07924 [Angomonas deanei]|eukprot:EPY34421.1 hypothetical protein AGDE_07924 [Angomonas deanei]